MQTDIDLSEITRCHCLAARRRARAVTRLYDSKLRPHGLRATQVSILAALAAAPPMPMGQLADILGLDRTTLTRGAALLEGHGWVDAELATDGRERQLRLTRAGKRKLETAYPAWRAAQDLVDRQLLKTSAAPAKA